MDDDDDVDEGEEDVAEDDEPHAPAVMATATARHAKPPRRGERVWASRRPLRWPERLWWFGVIFGYLRVGVTARR